MRSLKSEVRVRSIFHLRFIICHFGTQVMRVLERWKIINDKSQMEKYFWLTRTSDL